jgi:hypothetical protein
MHHQADKQARFFALTRKSFLLDLRSARMIRPVAVGIQPIRDITISREAIYVNRQYSQPDRQHAADSA